MPGAKYKVMAVGPQIAATATAPVFVSIAGVAKKVLPNQPFIVANELVCCNVARALSTVPAGRADGEWSRHLLFLLGLRSGGSSPAAGVAICNSPSFSRSRLGNNRL